MKSHNASFGHSREVRLDKRGWPKRCAAKIFKPWPFLWQKLLISLLFLHRGFHKGLSGSIAFSIFASLKVDSFWFFNTLMCIKYSPSLLIFIKNGGVILHFYNKTWSFRCRLKSNCSSVSWFYFFFTDSTRPDVVNRLKLDIIVINRFDPPIDIYQNIDFHGEIDR